MAQITAGVLLQYAPDNSPIAWNPSTDPISAIVAEWVTIDDITEMPEFGATPDNFETTALTNLEYKTYIPGLLDTGGTIAFKANDSMSLRDQLDDLDIALLAGKVWFRINVPKPVDQSLIFSGNMSDLGFGGAGINSVLTTTINIVPSNEPIWLENNPV